MIDIAQNSALQNSNLFKVQQPQLKTINVIENKTYDEERALYNVKDTYIKNCTFAGPRDGESSLKESRNIVVDSCNFSLRYPLWHNQKYVLKNSNLDEKTRAPIWYANNGYIDSCKIESVKCLREFKNSVVKGEYLAGFQRILTLIIVKSLKLKLNIKGHVDSIKNPKSGKITVDSVGEIILEVLLWKKCPNYY
ncbi:hypothetical protein BCR32DRAFT_331032 [Anaeromyces robustus]|uniref:Uncharacterized protein n=1 Tax=Anaeromyces robustus TaxID=1754192 RepID=A0A1Y1UWQ7_9FUNG|nr:hypothetical protein BCR32DRAFT_331032 [Anaeromyces robustus]|eukprot:ORX42520.1 hypothetical protein BCR32DRAFT_331032 [Anaeromyces robustus]